MHVASNCISIKGDHLSARTCSRRQGVHPEMFISRTERIHFGTAPAPSLVWTKVLGRAAPDRGCCLVSGGTLRCPGPTQGRRAWRTLSTVRPPGHQLPPAANLVRNFQGRLEWPSSAADVLSPDSKSGRGWTSGMRGPQQEPACANDSIGHLTWTETTSWGASSEDHGSTARAEAGTLTLRKGLGLPAALG